jgi:hypothetical protein
MFLTLNQCWTMLLIISVIKTLYNSNRLDSPFYSCLSLFENLITQLQKTSVCFKCTDELNCRMEAYSYIVIPLNKRNKTAMVTWICACFFIVILYLFGRCISRCHSFLFITEQDWDFGSWAFDMLYGQP